MKNKMLKYFSLVLIMYSFIVLINGCSSEKEVKKETGTKVSPPPKILNIESEERKYIKKNSIKEIDKLSFDFDKNRNPINEKKISAVKYDTDGFITETIIYNSSNKVENIFSYEYKNNFRIKTIRETPEGNADKYYTYEYNKYGNKIKSTRYNLSGEMEKYYIYDYDDNGNLVKEIWYDKTGEKEYSIEYEYNNSGQKTAAKSYNENSDLVARYEYKYDKNGNIIEELRYDPDDDEVGVIQYIYKYY
jgi:hypothetical protein